MTPVSPFRLVPRPHLRPYHCAALRHIGASARGVRWVDTGATVDRDRIYLSETAVALAARLLGWVPGGEVRLLADRLAASDAALEQARAEAAELRAAWDAVDVIERNGLTAKGVK